MHSLKLRAATWPGLPSIAKALEQTRQAPRENEPGTLTREEIREIVLEILG